VATVCVEVGRASSSASSAVGWRRRGWPSTWPETARTDSGSRSPVPITLDLICRQADAGSGPIPLAEREFLLLGELMRNAGHSVSKERLLSSVWGNQIAREAGVPARDVYEEAARLARGELGG